jgi:amino acid adenylation domain-containing protein
VTKEPLPLLKGTERDYPVDEPMQAAFESHVTRAPDAVAVVHGDHAVTYRALDRRAELWARRCAAAGAGPGTVVGVRMGRTPELVAALLGVLKSGAAYLPLDPAYPAERLRYMASDAGLVAVVGDGDAGRAGVPVLSADGPAPGPRRPHPHRGDAVAYVLYTSGSSGRPKGVAIAHANAVDLLCWCAETFGPDLHRTLATTSVCFDCSILEIFGPLSSGGTVVLADSAMAVGSVVEGHGVTLLHTVPSVMAELVAAGILPRSVTTVLLGGEPPWPGLIDDTYRHSGVRRVLNVYGPTECTSYATAAVVTAGASGTPPIGRPVANTSVHLLDGAGTPVPAGTAGEIYIGGHGVARGYLDRPALTAERFVPDPCTAGGRVYRTGDLARRSPGGDLVFLGRIDDQVKVRGVRVEPVEVEQALLLHPGVAEAVVTAPHDGQGRPRLLAHVVAAPGGPAPTPAQLRAFAGTRLPPPLVPDSVTVVARLPRAPNGKIDKAALAEAGAAGCSTPPDTAVRDPLEALIAGVWAEAIRVPEVGRYDDFYQLGGHSLSAMRIRETLRATTGVELPLRAVFELRTVASLADAVRPMLAGAGDPPGAAAVRAPARRPGGAGRALSPNQRAVLRRLAGPPDPTMHLPICVRLTGPLRPAALSATLTGVVRRHEVLRTSVEGVDDPDRAVGRPAPAGPVELPLVDLSGLPERRRNELATTLSEAASRAPFDLGVAPILRGRLFRLSPADHVLAVSLHQVAGDVWSMAGVARKLIGGYQELAAAEPPDLSDRSVQYADWAADLQQWLDGDEGRTQLRWWRATLAGVPVLALPFDGTRLPAGVAPSESLDFPMDPELLEALNAVGRRDSATLYMVLVAALRILAGAWSGQRDVAIGCPMTGRARPELATALGPFVNAVVLRTTIEGDPTFRDVLCRVRDVALAAYAHGDVPFATLVLDPGVRHDPGRHPLYQASVALHYPNEPVPMPPELDITDFGRRPRPHTSLDLDLTVYVDDPGATCALTYRTDLLDAAGANRFAAAYLDLLRAAVADPDRPVSSCPIGPL